MRWVLETSIAIRGIPLRRPFGRRRIPVRLLRGVVVRIVSAGQDRNSFPRFRTIGIFGSAGKSFLRLVGAVTAFRGPPDGRFRWGIVDIANIRMSFLEWFRRSWFCGFALGLIGVSLERALGRLFDNISASRRLSPESELRTIESVLLLDESDDDAFALSAGLGTSDSSLTSTKVFFGGPSEEPVSELPNATFCAPPHQRDPPLPEAAASLSRSRP